MGDTYWFNATLTPASLARFDLESGVPAVWEHYTFQIVQDKLVVRGSDIEDDDWTRIQRKVGDLCDLIIAIYTLNTGNALTVNFDRVLSVRDVPIDAHMSSAFFLEQNHDYDELGTDAMRKAIPAADYVEALSVQRETSDFRFALLDMHQAHLDRGDDWAIWAYRAVEDCARAIKGEQQGNEWHHLHALLATTEADFKVRIKTLWEARDALAHGRRGSPEALKARKQYDEILQLVRIIVTEVLMKSDPYEAGRDWPGDRDEPNRHRK